MILKEKCYYFFYYRFKDYILEIKMFGMILLIICDDGGY